jgi:hypothetical protein
MPVPMIKKAYREESAISQPTRFELVTSAPEGRSALQQHGAFHSGTPRLRLCSRDRRDLGQHRKLGRAVLRRRGSPCPVRIHISSVSFAPAKSLPSLLGILVARFGPRGLGGPGGIVRLRFLARVVCNS